MIIKIYEYLSIRWLLQQNKIDLVLGYSVPGDYTHGVVHTFVGGDMDETKDSTNDPIFFLMHSFVDMIWELWRITNQNRNERNTSYPVDREVTIIQ
uniref:Tyrosinase copper-binding domain-containing protein n=1 Tax=Meloidogyne floridensis TaxID=298350 RepID=A0A915NGD3_9BILA